MCLLTVWRAGDDFVLSLFWARPAEKSVREFVGMLMASSLREFRGQGLSRSPGPFLQCVCASLGAHGLGRFASFTQSEFSLVRHDCRPFGFLAFDLAFEWRGVLLTPFG